MDSIRNITSLWLALLLSLGIGTASLFPEYLYLASIILSASIGYTFIALIVHYKKPSSTLGLRSILLSSIFLIGYILYLLSLPENNTKHFAHFYKENKKHWMLIEVQESLKPTSYYQQYIVKIQQLDKNQTNGKVWIRMRKQDSLEAFFPGQQKLLYASVKTLAGPVNPFDIDMRKHYNSLGVFHRITINKNDTILALNSKVKQSWLLRKKTLDNLNKTNLQENSKQLIQAMVLGYRDEWSTEKRNQYSDAGVAHILAISGLHVGILYLALYWVALPLQRLCKTRFPVYFLSILGLWFYAWFTGLSPSVTRSVSMISFFIVAKLLQRPAPNLHTLGSSYLVLLLIKPAWFFHIGFQMSYTAVFFILWLYPKLNTIWVPKSKVLNKIWQTALITCIAQLGVMPWTLHYFGKIPGLFLLSNLVIFSLVSVLLIGGLILLIVSWIGIYKGWIFVFYDFLTRQIDHYILWVSAQEKWIISVNKPDLAISLSLFALLLFTLALLWKRTYLGYRNVCFALFLLLTATSISKIKNEREEIWLLQQIGESHILHKTVEEVILFTNHNKVDSTYLWDRLRTNYVHKKIDKQKFPRSFKIDNTYYLQIDSSAIYPKQFPINNVIILQQSARVHLDQLISELQPKLILADASNYPNDILRWKETCAKRKTPFLSTSEEGAILLGPKVSNLKRYPEMISDSLAKLSLR